MEAAFLSGLTVVGLIVGTYALPGVGRLGRGVLAFPIGLTIYVVIATTLLVARVPYSVQAVTGLLAGACLVMIALGPRRITAIGERPIWLVGSPLLVAGLSIFFQNYPLTKVTSDSFRYIELGRLLAEFGDLHPLALPMMLKRPPFIALVHAPGEPLTDVPYLVSASPIFGLATIGVFVWLGTQVLHRLDQFTTKGLVVLGSATLFLVSSNLLVLNLFYINGHMFFAAHLLILVVATWLARQTDSPGLLYLATLSLVALVLLRVEAELVIALFLVAVIADQRMPRAWKRILVGANAVTVVAWYGLALRMNVNEIGHPKTWSIDGILLVAIALTLLLAAREAGLARLLLDRSADALLVVLTLALPTAFVLRNELMTRSLVSAFENIVLGEGLWGLTWIVLPILIVGTLINSDIPARDLWRTSTLGFLLLWLIIPAIGGGGYRTGVWDSGNRMLMHVTPLVTMFIVAATVHRIPRGRNEERRHARRDVQIAGNG